MAHGEGPCVLQKYAHKCESSGSGVENICPYGAQQHASMPVQHSVAHLFCAARLHPVGDIPLSQGPVNGPVDVVNCTLDPVLLLHQPLDPLGILETPDVIRVP